MHGSLITHDVMLLRTAESRRGLVTLTGYLQGQNKRVKNNKDKAVNLNPPECFNRPNLIKKSGGFPSWRHHGGEVTGVWGRLSSRFPFPSEAHRWRPRSEGNPVIKQRHPQHVTLPTALSPPPTRTIVLLHLGAPISVESSNGVVQLETERPNEGRLTGNEGPKLWLYHVVVLVPAASLRTSRGKSLSTPRPPFQRSHSLPPPHRWSDRSPTETLCNAQTLFRLTITSQLYCQRRLGSLKQEIQTLNSSKPFWFLFTSRLVGDPNRFVL